MGLTGKVYLVGAGPGDAGLLTLRGAELLRRADVVVYDSLVNRELLALAPGSAEVLFGGKRPRDRAIPQEELNRLLAEKAAAGKTVVRLKGGDPYIFGRGGEEAARLRCRRPALQRAGKGASLSRRGAASPRGGWRARSARGGPRVGRGGARAPCTVDRRRGRAVAAGGESARFCSRTPASRRTMS